MIIDLKTRIERIADEVYAEHRTGEIMCDIIERKKLGISLREKVITAVQRRVLEDAIKRGGPQNTQIMK